MKTLGTNSWNGSGSVCSDVVYNKTGSGDDACGFRIVINRHYRPPLYLRVNLYGGNVNVCRRLSLGVGDFVVVDGEIMTRMGRQEELIEIRGREISITKDRSGE